MPHFIYHAKRGPDETQDGTIEAATFDEAIERLGEQGLLPVRLDEISAETAAKVSVRSAAAPRGPETAPPPAKTPPPAAAPPAPSAKTPAVRRRGLFSGVRSAEVTIFSRQLATLIRSGVPILRALMIISDQTPNPAFREVLERAQDEVRNGSTLSSVLTQYPKLFPPIAIAMVRAGEDSGTLQEALYRISDYRQRQEEIRSRIRTAMAYPILMALVGIGTVAFMLTFVIPRLSGLFATMGGDLPLPTRILMSVSSVFQQKLFWGALVAIAAAVTLVLRAQGPRALALWSAVSLKLPVFGPFTMKAEIARFARTLELLIKSGIPILRAIEVTTPVLDNTVLRAEFQRTRDEVQGGGSLGGSLRESGIFPPFMTNLLAVGEESGKIDEALSEIAIFYERETDEAIKIMTSLLEPLMILVMGLIVGFIVIAMLLPMFELNMMVK